MRNQSLVSFPTHCRRFFCQSIPLDLYDPPFSLSRKGDDGSATNVGLKSEGKGDDGSSDLPFHFRYSYSETDPSIKPIGFRESPKFSPFGPGRLDRKWIGTCAPVNHQVDIKRIQEERNRILGAPLEEHEVSQLVERYRHSDCSRQINLGKGGVTHNTLDDIHNHWKKAEAVRIKCLGVPTLDMDNICFHLEDKSGGKIIYTNINILLLYRGRHYDPTKRPLIPLMLWKPYAPIYPKLVNNLIPSLTHVQTKQLRNKGFNSHPLMKLTRNGVYVNVVERVREAFKTDEVLRLDCTHVGTSQSKKIGVKLRLFAATCFPWWTLLRRVSSVTTDITVVAGPFAGMTLLLKQPCVATCWKSFQASCLKAHSPLPCHPFNISTNSPPCHTFGMFGICSVVIHLLPVDISILLRHVVYIHPVLLFLSTSSCDSINFTFSIETHF